MRACAADWRHILAWCRDQRRQPFSGDEALEPNVGEYLASIGTAQVMSTLRRRVAAIVRQAPPGAGAVRQRQPARPRDAARRLEWTSASRSAATPTPAPSLTCPVTHLRRWLDAAKVGDGAMFRRVDCWGRPGHCAINPDSVRLVLARLATAACIVGNKLEQISPHGLRAGLITTAYGNGVSDERIMQHTRQRSLETMRGYVRRA